MKVRFRQAVIVVPLCLLVVAGCNNNQNGGMKMQAAEKATINLADNETVQKAFSEGRVKVMQKDQNAQREILQNALHEQEMLLNNQDEFRRSVKIQQLSRDKAVKDGALQQPLLEQIVREQSMVMEVPDLRMQVLQQNIQMFHTIAATPELRSQMADAMLLLMQDPKIKQQMEQMIKMAVEQAMKKMMAQMQAQMKGQMKQMQQQSKSGTPTKPKNQPPAPKQDPSMQPLTR